MWKKLVLISCLAGMVPLHSFAQENAEKPKVVYRPAEEVFEDESTGLKFISRISSYNKFAVSCNVNPVYGTIIRYQNEVACGDIYIYSLDSKGSPVTPDALQKEFADVVKSISSMPQRSSLIKAVTPESSTGIKLPAGVSGQCFRIKTGDGEMKSLLLMFLYKGKVIKIRASFPIADPQEEAEALLFCREILKLTGSR